MYQIVSNLNDVLDESHKAQVVIYKHSAICNVSFSAQAEVDKFMQESGTDVYRVIVQEQRPLSNEIEQVLGIRHESPQLLVIKNGQAESIDHFQITSDSIKSLLNK